MHFIELHGLAIRKYMRCTINLLNNHKYYLTFCPTKYWLMQIFVFTSRRDSRQIREEVIILEIIFLSVKLNQHHSWIPNMSPKTREKGSLSIKQTSLSDNRQGRHAPKSIPSSLNPSLSPVVCILLIGNAIPGNTNEPCFGT